MAIAKTFQIIKKPDDRKLGKKILRISIGGNKSLGYYIVYRGELSEIRELIGSAFKAMSVLNVEPDIDEGN